MAEDPPAAHDELARRFHDAEDDVVTTSWAELPIKKYVEQPAVRGLLSDVVGERVLDVGCGDGETLRWLLDHGADAVGVDASEESLKWARETVAKEGGEAEFILADLRDGLPFDDSSFDVVVTQYTLDLIEEIAPVFEEFARLLAPGGTLVFSVEHPIVEFMDGDFSYFDDERRPLDWGFTEIDHYSRPVSGYLNPLADAGFVLERFVEPEPEPELDAHHPELYEGASSTPRVLCVRAHNSNRLE